MATWEASWSVVNRADKRVRLVAVRTDGDDVRSFPAVGKIDPADLQPGLRAVCDTAFSAYEQDVANEAADAARVAPWKTPAEDYLNSKETP